MTNLMIEALEDNTRRVQNKEDAIRYGCAKSEVGLVEVRLSLAEGVHSQVQSHMRKIWYFNGKRIAAKKLEAILAATSTPA
jgi:hypothetical protein